MDFAFYGFFMHISEGDSNESEVCLAMIAIVFKSERKDSLGLCTTVD